jgi:hypothetical protein
LRRELTRELERIEVPDEHAARERAWGVLSTAFAERTPVEHRARKLRPALALAVVLAVVASAISAPGKAVLDQIRDVVGVQHAAPALFSLPSGGKLLIRSDGGVWVAQANGSTRRLGAWNQASWSPFGRFVVAARANELTTLEPDGQVHWTLARPAVSAPSWGGTRTDTRIAYVSGRSLRVVAGDGTDDRSSCADAVGGVTPAWQPGAHRVLAVAAPDGVVSVYGVDGCRLLWRARPGSIPRKLAWSSDGRLLLVLSRPGLRVYDGHGHVVARDDPSDATFDTDAAFVPGSHRLVAVRVHGAQSDVFDVRTGRSLFHVAGALDQVVPGPDGRWLLVTWPSADQWVFVRSNGRGIRAISNISEQFDSGAFPEVEGWAP